ncbi:dihydroorotase [Thermobrachium celere]|uniref:Dihydroorotase n=1 Tax=Thermobrachium celere DSM 8682 TaxID=941824 RepID=R7RT13_9CLOT|nr:dihydroorotase [Thermobrachium celere]CDF59347.1 Dihydroorotase [Thermobrachium celere DSM 8682]
MNILIKNARVVDLNRDEILDVYIENGVIKEVGLGINRECSIIDGKGLVLLPSFVDMHCHFRDPGFTYKEDILTGSLAAVKGGYTGVNLMGNTNPPCSNSSILEYVISKSKEINLIDIHQTVTITRNMEGTDISHLDELKFPTRFISDDGKGVLRSKVMLDAMMKAKKMGITVISHAEDEDISKVDTRLSENIMTIRDISLAKFTGASLHVAHVSTKESINEIIRAKKEGVNVTCEVTPHHIALFDNDYKVNPPIRKKEDVDRLIYAIKNGYVDVIATDHAPHTKEDKEKGAPGISGLETAFSVCYTYLVKEGHIDLKTLSKLMSKNPSKLMGLNKGQIDVGFDGDVVLVDLNKKYRVDSRCFVSKGKNTPFNDMEIYGEVVMTIKAGRVVYKRGDESDNRQVV